MTPEKTLDITSIRPHQLFRAENEFTMWCHTAKPGTTVAHVMDPDYWGDVAGRVLRTPNKGFGDIVRVIAEDGSFDLWLVIVEIDSRGLWARVRPLDMTFQSKEGPQIMERGDYMVEYGGTHHKWRIIDRAGQVVEKGLPNKEAAQAKVVEIRREKEAA